MSKVIRAVDGKFAVCKENFKEDFLIKACYKLNYMSDDWSDRCDLVYVNHVHNGENVVSLVIVQGGEYKLTNSHSSTYHTPDIVFEDYVERELAMNCKNESEAVKMAAQYLHGKMIEEINEMNELNFNLSVI